MGWQKTVSNHRHESIPMTNDKMSNEKWKMIFAFKLTQVNQPTLKRRGGGLRSVGHTELAENIIDVALDGRFTDVQSGSDCFVAVAGHDLFEHFSLSRR